MNKKLTDITLRLIELKYAPIVIDESDENKDGEIGDAGDAGDAVNYKHYNYLLKMPISQLTYDRKVILEKEYNELNEKLKNLKNTKIEDLWLSDLDALEKEWIIHRDIILKEYENDRLGIVDSKVANKKKAKK
jgi:hypothetical protein